MSCFLPFYTCTVAAGFPSPAEDYVVEQLNLNEHLIKHPAATFLIRVAGNSMTHAGIHDGDILIVDRSLEAKDGSVIVAAIDGRLTVKYLRIQENEKVTLHAAHPDYPAIEIKEGSEFYIWGVVTNTIHSF